MNLNYKSYLEGGGEMGALTRSFDWTTTSLGHPRTWPVSLLTTVSIVLNSRFPMFIWWGPELIQFYNDAYRPSLGKEGKHPMALGQKGADCWQEIWPVIKPLIDQVMAGGESTWSEDQLIPIYRNNQLEDVYWTFSYSKIINDDGAIGGVLVTCTETTRQVQALAQIKEAKSELDFALDAATLGTWDLNPTTNKFMGNDRLKSWFGLPPESEIDLSMATNVIVQDDRQRIMDAISRAMNPDSGGIYDVEYKIINPANQEARLVRARGKTLFGPDKRPFRFSGTLQDITGEHNAVEQLKVAHQKLEQAYEQSRLSKEAAQLGTFDMDLEKGTMEWDDRCRHLFGISHRQKVSFKKDFVGGLHPDDRDRIMTIINGLFADPALEGNYDVEYRTVGAEDQQVRWIRAKGKVYFNWDDRPMRFIGSVLDITEQKLDEIRKNDFIGMVSHELKTPLTSLKAYLQLLNSNAATDEPDFAKMALGRAEIQVRKMTSIINGFLDVARLESGKIYLTKEHFILNHLIDELVDETRLTAAGWNIIFPPCAPIVAFADRDKIGSVISNLLANAVKYSDAGSSIGISCVLAQDEVTVSIRDEGIGIRKEDMEKLFERFHRVENDARNVSGFGIGLYLSAEIIKRHNGSMWVDSTPGAGSVFYFSLPLVTVAGMVVQAEG